MVRDLLGARVVYVYIATVRCHVDISYVDISYVDVSYVDMSYVDISWVPSGARTFVMTEEDDVNGCSKTEKMKRMGH